MDPLLRRFSDDLTWSERFRGMMLAIVVIDVVAFAFDGLFSSSPEPTAPLLSRHVGHNLTKREMSSFGTLLDQHFLIVEMTSEYHE